MIAEPCNGVNHVRPGRLPPPSSDGENGSDDACQYGTQPSTYGDNCASHEGAPPSTNGENGTAG